MCVKKTRNVFHSLLMNVENLLLNFLKTKCNSVREGQFLPFLIRCYTYSSKYFIIHFQHLSVVHKIIFLVFSHTNMHIFKKKLTFLQEGLQIAVLQQRYTQFKSKKRGDSEIKIHNNPNLALKFFS